MKEGQLAKQLGWKEKWMDSSSLPIFDNYHLPRENASFDIIIFTDIRGEDDFRWRW